MLSDVMVSRYCAVDAPIAQLEETKLRSANKHLLIPSSKIALEAVRAFWIV